MVTKERKETKWGHFWPVHVFYPVLFYTVFLPQARCLENNHPFASGLMTTYTKVAHLKPSIYSHKASSGANFK